MSRKTSTSVAQVTGCLPLPVSHCFRISILICSASFKCLWATISTLDPSVSSRRKVPNWKYLLVIFSGILNFSSSGRVGFLPGYMWWAKSVEVTGSCYKTESIKCVTRSIAFNYKYTVTLTVRLRETVLYDSSLLCSLLGYSCRESNRKENENIFMCMLLRVDRSGTILIPNATVTKLVVAPIINSQVASGLMSFAGSLSGVIVGWGTAAHSGNQHFIIHDKQNDRHDGGEWEQVGLMPVQS